jgi:hypothetical protein
MFILAAFFAISGTSFPSRPRPAQFTTSTNLTPISTETDTIFNRVMEGVGTIFCFGALVATAGVSYLIYKDQKHVAARGYSVYHDDAEEQKGLVDDGLADDA